MHFVIYHASADDCDFASATMYNVCKRLKNMSKEKREQFPILHAFSSMLQFYDVSQCIVSAKSGEASSLSSADSDIPNAGHGMCLLLPVHELIVAIMRGQNYKGCLLKNVANAYSHRLWHCLYSEDVIKTMVRTF